MKNHIVSLFFIVCFITNGCGDTSINNSTEKTEDILPEEQQVKQENNLQAETKILPVKKKTSQSVFIKNSIKDSTKYDKKLPKSETGNNPETAEQILDLSVPFTPKTKKTGHASSNVNRNYLPDLFNAQMNNKNQAMQLEAKIIRREESSVDKDKVVDGAGINIKMTR